MKKILVLCTGNSCRSQMAEGYLRHFTKGHTTICSAGNETHAINPKAVQAMKEDGIDISGHTCNHVDDYRHIDFDIVITVCDTAREQCPVFPSTATMYHHNFPDPAKATGTEEEVRQQFREVRAQIKDYCEKLVAQQEGL